MRKTVKSYLVAMTMVLLVGGGLSACSISGEEEEQGQGEEGSGGGSKKDVGDYVDESTLRARDEARKAMLDQIGAALLQDSMRGGYYFNPKSDYFCISPDNEGDLGESLKKYFKGGEFPADPLESMVIGEDCNGYIYRLLSEVSGSRMRGYLLVAGAEKKENAMAECSFLINEMESLDSLDDYEMPEGVEKEDWCMYKTGS